jgi:mRNA interferase RelE/StbE
MRGRAGAASLGSYRIFETEQFAKDLQALARSGLSRIERKLREVVYPELRDRPHFGPHIKKLKGWEPETWRYRIGAWRFFYEIDEAERLILLVGAAHRSAAY